MPGRRRSVDNSESIISRLRAPQRPGWARRFWLELGSTAGEHDAFVRLIILERLVKSAVLVLAAISLVAADRLGYLARLAAELQEQLNLSAGRGVFISVLTWVVRELGAVLPHVTVLALGLLLYAALETTEGIGLAMHRRWAEYLAGAPTRSRGAQRPHMARSCPRQAPTLPSPNGGEGSS